jgi:predicted transcriptional regulator
VPVDSERELHKRTKIGICAQILAVLQQESLPRKTQLAQRCKLDTRTAKYIDFMIGTGLIEQFDGNHLTVSFKGEEFLKSYYRLINFLDQDRLR